MVQLHVARTALSCRQLVRSEHIINRRRRDLRAPACAGFGNWQKKRERKEAERKSREWEEVQASGRVDAESAFDIKVQKCLALYQSFLSSPVSRVSAAATGDGESILLTGLFALFTALFATVVYIVLSM
uniref:Uncharacterized protein n=1 Tax=Tetraselmis chuii TaxID=63592 RepID=A0A6U1E3E1_9CHLO|mmetsp:Transcript_14847/g.26266  ORF Transcript_14847/g.26266 Transcript_14847/m.26266 type:complete len:129 (+) Transcript_14847:143-529(+)